VKRAPDERPASRSGPAAGVRWDLSHLYEGPDDPRLDADLDASLSRSLAFAERYRDRLGALEAPELALAVDELEALQEPVARVGAYAQLLFAADTSEPRHGALLQHVQERITEIRNALLFFELEWVSLDTERADALLTDAALANRRHHLVSLRRYEPHVLTEPEERILGETANTGRHAFSRLFDEIMTDARFQVTRDGQTRELSEEEVLALLYDPDREARREGARALTAGLRDHARVLAFIFNTLVQDKAVDDRLRAYEAPIAARNLANEIEATSVKSLLDACVARYSLVARYYRLKARLLDLPRLEDYDRYAPVAGAESARSFDDAKRIVLDAYGDFAPSMADVARRFFDERWIDAELRDGKRGGAFSASTTPAVHPYVLLNFTGNLRDVMTVAHELGHGVHQYLAADRGLFEQDTPLTTAETASVFGEMLVFRRLMREERDPSVRLALLCGKTCSATRCTSPTTTPGGGSTSPTSCTPPSTATPTRSASSSCWHCCGATTRRALPSCRATWSCSRPGAPTAPRPCSPAPASTSETRPSGTAAWTCSRTSSSRRRRWRAEAEGDTSNQTDPIRFPDPPHTHARFRFHATAKPARPHSLRAWEGCIRCVGGGSCFECCRSVCVPWLSDSHPPLLAPPR
jgi:oligoendopeptidase F